MLNIKDNNLITLFLEDKYVGAISFKDNKISFSDNFNDKILLDEIAKLQTDGIPYVKYIHNDEKHISLFERSFPNDDNFFFELSNYLKKEGYKIEEENLDIDKEIAELVSFLPKGEKLAKDIIENLPKMNFLEKTYIKYELEDKFNELSNINKSQ